MSLKLYKPNSFHQFLSLYPYPIYPSKLKKYTDALDELTLSRIKRLRKFICQSSNFAKDEVLRCANAIADFNPGPFSKSHKAMLLLSIDLHHLKDNHSSRG